MSNKKKTPVKDVDIMDSVGFYLHSSLIVMKKIADSSIELYKGLFNVDSEDQVTYYRTKGIDHAKKAKYQKALPLLNIARQENPEDETVLYYLGLSLIKTGDHKQGIEVLEEGAKLDNKNIKLFTLLGTSYSKLEEYNKAIQVFEQALAFEKTVNLYYRLGFAYDNEKNHDKAIACFKEAMLLEPDNVKVCHAIGLAYESKGNRDEAVKFFKKALELEEDV
ncbi:tetratricopeptide repeat protein [Deltaproteobacteria bacterium TL4]